MENREADGCGKRTTVVEDLLRIAMPSTPRLSPDGTRVAFILRTVDTERNAVVGRVHVVPADGSAEPVAWTHGSGSESDPRWSPDGNWLGFVSTREDGTPALYRMPTAGGEAVRVMRLPEGGLGAWDWSPCGTRIAFTFRAADPLHTRDAVEARSKMKQSTPPRVIERIRWRMEGGGFLPPDAFRLGVVSVDGSDMEWVVEEPGRDVGDFAWTPDGRQILFAVPSAPDPDRRAADMAWRMVDIDTQVQRSIDCPEGPKGAPTFRSDGKAFAWFGHDDPNETWGVRNLHVWTTSLETGKSQDLVAGHDVTVGDCTLGEVWGRGDEGPVWDEEGRVLCLVSDRGRVHLEAFSAEGRERVAEDVGGFSRASGRTAFLRHSAVDAGDVWVDSRQITRCNREWLDQVYLVEPISIGPAAPDGALVPAFVLLPPDWTDASRPRPTLLYLHGGPHLMYGERRLFHEYQALAAAGYVVIFPNPRGSKGYGEAWTRAIQGDWGDPAMLDVLACVDHCVAQGWADPERLGIVGGSYGGYLTAWTIGRTDRFKAAAPERGVYDLLSMAGTTDFAWRDRDYFRADTYSDVEEYRRNSPMSLVANVKTPVMLIHSEGDLRCPVGQAEQYFRALKWAGNVETCFLRYGAEGTHELSRGGPPDLRVDRQRRIRAWFDRHLGGEGETA